jgi:hypothetical protein
VWESPGVLKRRVPRLLATGFLLLVATSGLSACRTAPNVAAYVGDEQVTVSELDAAVAERVKDDDIAAYAKEQGDDYTRRVLDVLVSREVYDAAAERYGVTVSDAAVRDRIDELLQGQGQDPDAAFADLAKQGVARVDAFEGIREALLRQEIAKAAGKADALSEESLRAGYAATKDSAQAVAMGYITVPDQATADATLARLTASPADYPAVAAQFPGPSTLPELRAFTPDQIPGVLAPGVQAAAPGTGFTTPVTEAGGIVVTFVQGPPTFEQSRATLEQQATGQVDQAGAALVKDVRDGLHVRINPRFKPTDGDSGLVDILGNDDTSTG